MFLTFIPPSFSVCPCICPDVELPELIRLELFSLFNRDTQQPDPDIEKRDVNNVLQTQQEDMNMEIEVGLRKNEVGIQK